MTIPIKNFNIHEGTFDTYLNTTFCSLHRNLTNEDDYEISLIELMSKYPELGTTYLRNKVKNACEGALWGFDIVKFRLTRKTGKISVTLKINDEFEHWKQFSERRQIHQNGCWSGERRNFQVYGSPICRCKACYSTMNQIAEQVNENFETGADGWQEGDIMINKDYEVGLTPGT